MPLKTSVLSRLQNQSAQKPKPVSLTISSLRTMKPTLKSLNVSNRKEHTLIPVKEESEELTSYRDKIYMRKVGNILSFLLSHFKVKDRTEGGKVIVPAHCILDIQIQVWAQRSPVRYKRWENFVRAGKILEVYEMYSNKRFSEGVIPVTYITSGETVFL